jgi:hypothetical protein
LPCKRACKQACSCTYLDKVPCKACNTITLYGYIILSPNPPILRVCDTTLFTYWYSKGPSYFGGNDACPWGEGRIQPGSILRNMQTPDACSKQGTGGSKAPASLFPIQVTEIVLLVLRSTPWYRFGEVSRVTKQEAGPNPALCHTADNTSHHRGLGHTLPSRSALFIPLCTLRYLLLRASYKKFIYLRAACQTPIDPSRGGTYTIRLPSRTPPLPPPDGLTNHRAIARAKGLHYPPIQISLATCASSSPPVSHQLFKIPIRRV